MHRTLRCYLFGAGDDWEAICLDLDIAVQGRSSEEAQASLAKGIRMYPERTSELPADEQPGLLYRSVPLAARIRLMIEGVIRKHRQYLVSTPL
jgi:hypothetical protein